MSEQNIIKINGQAYDASTGQPAPVHAERPNAPTPQTTASTPKAHRAFSDIAPARSLHHQPQKSQTLRRENLHRPVSSQQRSPSIARFAPTAHSADPAAMPPEPPVTMQAPRDHPAVVKITAAQPAQTTQPQTPQELKEALIKERLTQARPNTHATKTHKRRLSRPRLAAVMTSTLALLLLGGYLTYINLPNISMRVAAMRAGISANYPQYNPDGYHFSGPITYKPGEVNISFRSNTNSGGFVIKQKTSTWDSQAVLDNYVTKQTGTYLTYQERGLTIYSFGNRAAWVNGGLLYTIDGNAPLSSDQLLHIATSM